MFEKFTERARQVVVHAQAEAREMQHREISTGHVLLGLVIEEECLAAKVLDGLGVKLPAARERLVAYLGEGARATEPVDAQIPFTEGCKRALEMALREALSLGHNYIGTEHILLAVDRAGALAGDPAGELLRSFGVSEMAALRNAVVSSLPGTLAGRPQVARPEALRLETLRLSREQLWAAYDAAIFKTFEREEAEARAMVDMGARRYREVADEFRRVLDGRRMRHAG